MTVRTLTVRVGSAGSGDRAGPGLVVIIDLPKDGLIIDRQQSAVMFAPGVVVGRELIEGCHRSQDLEDQAGSEGGEPGGDLDSSARTGLAQPIIEGADAGALGRFASTNER